MNRQLFQLVEEYQQTGDVSKLLAESYELLRYLPNFGKAAQALNDAHYVLLPTGPRETADDRLRCIRTAEAALKDAGETLHVMGCHPVKRDSNAVAYFPYGFLEGEVCTIYATAGKEFYASRGDFSEDYDDTGDVKDQWLEVVGNSDRVPPVAIPFVPLVKLVLILAAEAVACRRRED